MPIQVQVTIETTGRMLLGTEIGAALTTLDALRPDVIGLNCATGPAEMSEHLRYLSQRSPVPISVLPNAGLPSVVEGRMHYDLTPAQLAEHHARFITEYGVSVVGGCCGTTPDHLEAVVDACRDLDSRRAAAGMGARRGVDLQPRPVRPDPVSAGRRRAHQRQRVQEVPGGHAGRRLGHLPGHGPGGRQRRVACARRLRRLHRRGRRRRHAGGRQPLRHPGHPADHARLHRSHR